MKVIRSIIKRLCLGILGIYSVNVLFSVLNIVIPINLFTIMISSLLGVYGISAIIVLRMLI